MKRFLAHAVFFASLIDVVALHASAQTTTTETTPNDKRAEEEVRRLNAEEVEAFLHKDPQAMARLWSDDFVVTSSLNKFVNKLAGSRDGRVGGPGDHFL
jgi:hypothetical protein